MSLKELAQAILALPTAELDKPALVWPPVMCPAAQTVPIVGIVKAADGTTIVSTGKPPK